MSRSQPKVLSGNEPNFKFLSANLNILLSRSSEIKQLRLYLYSSNCMKPKWALVAFIAKVKEVVFENLLGAAPHNLFLLGLIETEGIRHFPLVIHLRLYIEAFHTVPFYDF